MLSFIKKTIQISFLFLAFFSIANFTFAQSYVSNSVSSVSLNLSPSNPRAGDNVVLTISSNSLDLTSAKIVWYIDGVARKETTNTSITIKTKSSGDKTVVRIVVETSDGITKEVTREISPVGVDLVIEPMSYVMPFYQGKPFFVAQGTVKIVAIPDITVSGTKLLSKNLNFKWTQGDNVLADSSGKGQNTLIIKSTIPVRDININVQVLDDSENVLAETAKLITRNSPAVLFYENSPLYGILYNKAIVGNYYLGTREGLVVVAKPFSFGFLKDAPREANYAWYVNNNSVIPSGKSNEIVFKQTSTDVSGMASVSLDLNNISEINQYTSGEFNVLFGQ